MYPNSTDVGPKVIIYGHMDPLGLGLFPYNEGVIANHRQPFCM